MTLAAIVWRIELTEAAARNWLAQNGFPEASLTVQSVSRARMVASDVDLGPDAPKVSRFVADYELFELLDSRVREIEITGLRATVDPTTESPAPWLDRFLDRPAEPAAPAHLPRIVLRDARIDVLGAPKPLAVNFNGEVVPDNGDASATLEGRTDATHTQLAFDAELTRLLTRPSLRLDAEGTSGLGELPWPTAWGPRPTEGAGQFAASYHGPLPALDGPFDVPQEAEATLSLDVDGATFPPYAEGVAGELALRAAVSASELTLHLSEPVRIRADHLDESALVARLRNPQAATLAASARQISVAPVTPAQPLLTLRRDAEGWHWNGNSELRLELTEGSGSLRVAAEATHAPDFALRHLTTDEFRLEASALDWEPHRLEWFTFDGRLEATPEELTAGGDLSLRMARLGLGEEALRDITFEAPVALSRAADGETALRLTGPGDLRLANLPDTSPLRIEVPSRITIPEGWLIIRDRDMEGEMVFDPGRLAGAIAYGDDPEISLLASPGPIALSVQVNEAVSAHASLRDAAIEVPDYSLAILEVDLEMTHDEAADRMAARLAFGRLGHLEPEPAFTPLRGEATMRLDGEHLLLDGHLGPRATDVVIPVQIEHALDRGTGLLRFGPSDLDFHPDILQPADLGPTLQLVEAAEGRIALQGGLDWGPDGLTSRGRLRIDELTAQFAGVQVERLAGAVDFDSLSPLRTAPEQILSAESATAVVPVTDLRLVFQLDVDPTTELPILRIAEARGRFAGGRLSVSGETFYPAAEVNTISLDVAQLSVADLLEKLNVEGVGGEGVLSGRIPVRFGEDGVVVSQGRLRSERSGVLHISLGDYGRALAGQGEQVAMMLNALDDFRYDFLDLTIDRDADGEARLGVQMEGHNPEVYEGYPFRFNVNLTGDMDPILLAMQAGQRLSTDLLQRALEAE